MNTAQKVFLAKLARFAVRAFVFAIAVFAVLPMVVTVMTSFQAGTILGYFRPVFSIQWYVIIFHDVSYQNALRVSLIIGAIATASSVIIGLLASIGLVRYDFMGKDALMTYFMSPLVVPGVVSGFGMLGLFAWVGIIDSFQRLLLAHIIITLPYTIRTVSATLEGFDRSLEEAAMNLGARPFKTFSEVTFPLIRPAVIAGSVLAFAASLDDIAVSVFLASARTTTLSVLLFSNLKGRFDPTIVAASVIIMAITFGILVFVERIMGLDKFVGVTMRIID